MRTTKLGDLTVSAQGLGCMGMSEWYGATDWDESIATIHAALDAGVTFLDTADVYGAGHNEVLVGRAIAHRRDEVQLATKFGIDRSGGDGKARVLRGERSYVKRAGEASLVRLGVEVIDLYYLHRPPQTAEIEETVGAMAELVAEGKVRYLGLSEVDSDLLRRAHAVHPITAVQSEYSLWTRDVENDVLDALRELGVGLVPYSPLGRGFLTGTVDVSALGSNDFRANNPRFTARRRRPTRPSPTPCARSPRPRAWLPRRSPWPGSTPSRSGSASRSLRSPAPSASSGSSRTSPPSTSRSPRTSWPCSTRSAARYPVPVTRSTG